MSIKIRRSSNFSESKGFRSTGPLGSLRITNSSSSSPIGPDTITLTQGMTVTTVSADGTYNYTQGDSVVLDSTYLDTSFGITQGMIIVGFGNTPVNLSTLSFLSSGIYTATVSGVTFYLNVTVPTPTGLVFTHFGSQVITGGESVTFSASIFTPTPTLTTTLGDTSWFLRDQFMHLVDAGSLPISNLRVLWATNALVTGQPYSMTASGITFTITRTGG